MGKEQAWAIRLTVLASEAEIESVVDRVGRAICADPDHAGPCAAAWEITYAPVDDLDVDERSSWLPAAETLLDQRRAETGTGQS